MPSKKTTGLELKKRVIKGVSKKSVVMKVGKVFTKKVESSISKKIEPTISKKVEPKNISKKVE